MSFRESAVEHLAKYKIDVLGIRQDGLWRNGVTKSHILPTSERELNILDRFREQFWSSESGKVKLHKYFHHLNSSQAMCINLFFPLMVEKSLNSFAKFLNVNIGNELVGEFEKESSIESTSGYKTSFDFYLESRAGEKIFVEAKYTEKGFDKNKGGDVYATKFREVYLPLVKAKSRYLRPVCEDENVFLENYQVLRNLVHICDNDRVVFLFPRGNTMVADEAKAAREEFLTEEGRERHIIVGIEELIGFLEEQWHDGPLERYYQSFRAKYLPAD